MVNSSLLTSIAGALPAAVLEEQVRLYGAQSGIVVKKSDTPGKLLVYPHLHQSRVQVVRAFHVYLMTHTAWTGDVRIPRGSAVQFAKTLEWPKRCCLPPGRAIAKWHYQSKRTAHVQTLQTKKLVGLAGKSPYTVANVSRRRNRGTHGGPRPCPYVRENLYA